ncbi:MAG: substrate-binding domain-containing protein [Lentisphaerae bacterium]|nr:substrate-binding domain-containing protein [Lentisphaerota bacterium]MBT4819748.1 substrate-binding domain-containing protein [Lentisphaerota bacterium]MBT5607401.1 substrate-binding domain-containing protein [Lentisphaerota bacterium]MBT7056109.1 substrate-binding domain-containing protein [Lentisphaerota bacterium]MBT7841347.1 substrate-binding domain-containing protein [Lentisphaerota bacterium]
MSVNASTQANRARRRLLAAFEEDYAPGDRLQPERELCEIAQVSRRILRSVLAQFEEEGVISLVGRKRFFLGMDGTPPAVTPWRNMVLLHSFRSAPPANAPDRYLPDLIHTHAVVQLREHGYDALFVSGLERLQQTLTAIESTPPAGVVCDELYPEMNTAHRMLAETVLPLRARGIPVLAVGNDPGVGQFDRVASDQCHGVFKLMSWLAEQGCRRILPAWHAPSPTDWVPMRDSGYQLAASELGLAALRNPLQVLDPAPQSLEGSEAIGTYARALKPFLTGDAPADAIMLTEDRQLPFAAAACRQLGRRPGKDVLLAGYDNTWQAFDVAACDAPAATIDKDYRGEGRELANLLHERLTGQLPDTPQIRWIPPRLVVPGDGESAQG